MRKRIDKLMFKLGYFPRRNMAPGNCLLVPEGKFEVLKLQGDKRISRRQLMERGLSAEKQTVFFKHDILEEVMGKIDELGEWKIDNFDTDLNLRVKYKLWLAIPKK